MRCRRKPCAEIWYRRPIRLVQQEEIHESPQSSGRPQILRRLVNYTIDSLTAEEDRVAAEIRSNGTFADGDTYENIYVFILRIRDGRIASVAEHFNPDPVLKKILPRLRAAMAKAAG